jgi:ketosteroid isomerase-like protein
LAPAHFGANYAVKAVRLEEQAVSQENVELVRAATEAAKDPEAVHRLAHGDMDAIALIAPDVEWDATGFKDVVPDLAEVYWGHEGVRTYWRRWLAAWRELEWDVQDYLDAGDDVVVLIINQHQWGRYTGIASEIPPFALVYTFRDGKVVRFRSFPDHDSALKAVGLEE